MLTYTHDVVFNDEMNSDSKGFNLSLADAIKYVKDNNGTNESYFKYYKSGVVEVICNETGEVKYTEDIKHAN